MESTKRLWDSLILTNRCELAVWKSRLESCDRGMTFPEKGTPQDVLCLSPSEAIGSCMFRRMDLIDINGVISMVQRNV